jgi:DNA polymerase-1
MSKDCKALKAAGAPTLCGLGEDAYKVQLMGSSLQNVIDAKVNGVMDKTYLARPGMHDIMIIDETPMFGDMKSRTGAPFMSDAGDKVIELVDHAKIDPRRIYITYMNKCTPKPKMKPTVEEIKACRVHLEKEIKAVQPKVILIMGYTGLRLFKLQGKGGIMKQRGSIYEQKWEGWEESPTFKIIPTLRPSMLVMRGDPMLEKKVVSDLRLANSAAGGKVTVEPYQCKFEMINDMEDFDRMEAAIRKVGGFAFDTEDRSFEWWEEPMLSLQFSAGKGKNWVLPWYHHASDDDPNKLSAWNLKDCWEPMEKEMFRVRLKALFEDMTLWKGAHNIKFDMNVVRKHLGAKLDGFMLYDSMIMHHLLWEPPPHDLETLADLEFGSGDYSLPVRDIVGHGNVKKPYDLIPDSILWPYGANDAELTFSLICVYLEKMKDKPHLLKLYTEESIPAIKATCEAEYWGMPIDADCAQRQIDSYSARRDELLLEMKKLTYPEFEPKDTAVKDELINAGYGDELKDKTKKSGYTVAAPYLMNINHPLAECVLEYRKIQKLVSTYFKALVDERDANGRFHPGFQMQGTVSGRPSASRVHQIPRLDDDMTAEGKEQPRHMFIAPEGYDYVYGDYSQMELITMALEAGDANMLKAIEDDLHDWTASAFLGFDSPEAFKKSKYRKYNRSNVGKPVNFGLQYGSEGHSLVAKGTWMDEQGKINPFTWEDYNRGQARWRELFPEVAQFQEDTPKLGRENGGIICTRFGRERRFQARLTDSSEGRRKAAEREALNFRCQSPASSVTLRTIGLIHPILQRYIKTNQLKEDDIIFTNTVHDSIAYFVRKHLTKWFIQEIFYPIANREIVEYDGFRFPIGIGVGANWAEAEINS